MIGVDEAGRGALAGPVVVVAAQLDHPISGLDDSKRLSPKKRLALYDKIINNSKIGVAIICPKTIFRLNILHASLLGMKKAILKLGVDPKTDIIIDGNKIPDMPTYRLKAIPKADSEYFAVSAASICAKVIRDRIMAKYDRIYEQYGFLAHKGYGTARHYDALHEYGPSPIHRKGFKLSTQGKLFE